MSDERAKFRNETEAEEDEVVAHKYVTDEPAEDESGKTKTKYKFKTKTEGSEELGDDDREARGKY